ncbi:MAG: NHLP bacteriocin system secretion protein [Microcoleaceae cyanobacterium]
MDKKHGFFRKEGLERLSSPERLDRLMQVVRPLDWLPLIALGVVGSLGIAWSIFGRIPIIVTGRGVLTQDIIRVQSLVSGTLESLSVRDGTCVEKNQVIAKIRPVELERQLQQKSEELAKLQREAQENSLQRLQQNQFEQQAIAEERANLEQRLRNTQSLASTLRDRGLTAIQAQRRSLEQRLRDSQALAPQIQEQGLNDITEQRNNLQGRLDNAQALADAYKALLDKRQALRERGAISQDIVLKAEQDYREALQQVSQIEAQLQQLNTQESQNQQAFLDNRNASSELQAELQQLQVQEAGLLQKYLENLNQISQIKAQLDSLETRSQRLQQEKNQLANADQRQVQDTRQAVTQLQAEVNSTNTREILSPKTGCLLQVDVEVGQLLQPETQIGTLEIHGATPSLENVAYFAVEDGQRIQPGMRILVTPSTLEGGRFGGIVGEVTTVSPLPVTLERATTTIGNSELAKTLWEESSGKIEAIARLQTDTKTPGGYLWSTVQSPDIELSAGTLTTAKITVEERSPITFVLPTLRKWSGFN